MSYNFLGSFITQGIYSSFLTSIFGSFKAMIKTTTAIVTTTNITLRIITNFFYFLFIINFKYLKMLNEKD